MVAEVKQRFRPPSNPAGHVYYAKLKTPQGMFYKIGYTSKESIEMRFSYNGSKNYLLIDEEMLFTFREDALHIEQKLLDHFDEIRAFGKYANDPNQPLCGDGQSELFRYDILGLDDSLYVLTDQDKRDVKRNSSLYWTAIFLCMVFGWMYSSYFLMFIPFVWWKKHKKHNAIILRCNKKLTHPKRIQIIINSLVDNSKHKKRQRIAQLV